MLFTSMHKWVLNIAKRHVKHQTSKTKVIRSKSQTFQGIGNCHLVIGIMTRMLKAKDSTNSESVSVSSVVRKIHLCSNQRAYSSSSKHTLVQAMMMGDLIFLWVFLDSFRVCIVWWAKSNKADTDHGQLT